MIDGAHITEKRMSNGFIKSTYVTTILRAHVTKHLEQLQDFVSVNKAFFSNEIH